MRDSHAKTRTRREKTHRPRLALGPADHGAARPARPALELTDPLGIAGGGADLARAPRRLRRGLADGAAGAAVGPARGGFRRARRRGRLQPHAARPGAVGKRPAAAQIRRAVEQAIERFRAKDTGSREDNASKTKKSDHADATVRLAPSACTTR